MTSEEISALRIAINEMGAAVGRIDARLVHLQVLRSGDALALDRIEKILEREEKRRLAKAAKKEKRRKR
jgi:hypothetical protein